MFKPNCRDNILRTSTISISLKSNETVLGASFPAVPDGVGAITTGGNCASALAVDVASGVAAGVVSSDWTIAVEEEIAAVDEGTTAAELSTVVDGAVSNPDATAAEGVEIAMGMAVVVETIDACGAALDDTRTAAGSVDTVAVSDEIPGIGDGITSIAVDEPITENVEIDTGSASAIGSAKALPARRSKKRSALKISKRLFLIRALECDLHLFVRATENDAIGQNLFDLQVIDHFAYREIKRLLTCRVFDNGLHWRAGNNADEMKRGGFLADRDFRRWRR